MSRSIDPSSVLINENVERFAVLASRVPGTLLSAGTRFALISALTFRPKAAEYKKEGGTNTSKTKNTYMALETKPLLPLRMPDYAPDCIMLSRLFEQSVGRAGILELSSGNRPRHTTPHLPKFCRSNMKMFNLFFIFYKYLFIIYFSEFFFEN